ncbi:MAG: DNA gyrase subunit A [Bosea sp. (in: a-proteobacteria)]
MSEDDDKKRPDEPHFGGDIKPISITDEMKKSYLDYAMSVIVSRALPDVRDGLKPVHRRILFSMHENKNTPDRPYTKCARIVGDTMGKYHPHGNLAVYDALVRMAQDFSLRLPLIDGQGNFGSMDGDSPAADRYTEARLDKAAMALLEDLDLDTVTFQPNYDGKEREPTVLPARFPNLLVNGAGGIAVGMATNIPPHNLGEVIDACVALIDNPEITIDELIEYVPGPDFPTGAMIMGRSGIHAAYHTGRGSIVMRSKTHIEELRKEREAIIVTEVPYQVNKASMVEKIAEMVREKRIEGVSDLRDESSREGVRVVIELKRDALSDVVLNQLYRFTQLQTSFGCNMVALTGGRPEVLNLRDFISAFVEFREEVVSKRTRYLLNKARERAHVLCGLATAVANIDEVIRLIRTAPTPAVAHAALMDRDWPADDIAPLIALVDDPRHPINPDGTYRLSDAQARAILELRLARLTALGRDEIGDELEKLAREIADYLDILRSRQRIQAIIKTELAEVKAAFATPRRTEIQDWGSDLDDEDLIAREDMVVTVSHAGYIKRVPLSTYRAQKRGGKGRSGMATRDEDFVTRLFVANTHTPIIFFSSLGQAYKEKVWRLPLAAPNARGKFLNNMLPLDPQERITTVMPLPENEEDWDRLDVMFATASGNVRRNKLSDFVNVNRNGKIAMKLDEGDSIVDVQICSEHDDVLLTTAAGQCIRFAVPEVRVFKGRDSTGVRGINLAAGDTVISLAILKHLDVTPEERATYLKDAAAQRRALNDETEESAEPAVASDGDEVPTGDVELGQEKRALMGATEQFILTVSERGYGKRSSSFEYRVTGRGGKGIVAMVVNDRNGKLVASFPVIESDQIMLVTNGGQVIRVPVDAGAGNRIRIAGRSTQGVTIFDTAEGEKVVSVECVSDDGEGEEGEAGPAIEESGGV